MKHLSHYALHCPSVHWKYFSFNVFLLHWLNHNNTIFKTSPDILIHCDQLHFYTNSFQFIIHKFGHHVFTPICLAISTYLLKTFIRAKVILQSIVLMMIARWCCLQLLLDQLHNNNTEFGWVVLNLPIICLSCCGRVGL